MYLKHFLSVVISLFFVSSFSQKKEIKYFDEFRQEINKRQFKKLIDYKNTIDIYIERDSLTLGLIVKRNNFGKLSSRNNNAFRRYLSEVATTPINENEKIVISYLYEEAELKTTQQKSTWNVLSANFLKRLHETSPNVRQFYIVSPKNSKLDYFGAPEIPWIIDADFNVERLFFDKPINSGIYILLKPNGLYYFYVGEYGDFMVLENASKFFAKK
ncbi:hypothetical protein [Urechidicola vernalis]|uniref:Uncharacterized protein n=1 Tax=Urechidicola vernalis TaxID=3075600 RepID=A0ABU2Y6H0_9FLAO|nr:hypothetical protein [Urechidicola sp. P050]MDT0553808.1 hypothetical protein [Urechidicola sp. P050]